MADSDDEKTLAAYESLEQIQRLKAALHYTVGKICETYAKNERLKYSKQFIAALTETTFREIDSFATDLELFAKHAKRIVINADDVILLSRRSSSLNQHMKEIHQELAEAHVTERANKKRRKSRSKNWH